MRRSNRFSRRTVLRGIGASVALPFMESLAPSVSASAPRPKRLSVFYIPNGMRMDAFRPAAAGADYPMPTALEPLEHLRDRFSVVTGLAHANAQALGDPGGAHGRSCAAFLTGAHPKPTEGSDLYNGISMDQRAADLLGAATPFRSLELGIEPSSLLGSCDIGFSCTYTNTLSWRTPTQALPVSVNPRDVFEQLFGDASATSDAARAALLRRRSSVLDFVRADARRLAGDLGTHDRRKLDEYLTAVRDVEVRIQRLGEHAPAAEDDAIELPAGIPDDFATHVGLMIDLQVLALRTDLTRVATFMLGRELSNRTYPEIGVPDSHHSMSHHGGDPVKIDKLVKISRLHLQQFGRLLERLEATPDGDGTLLDSTLVLGGASLGEPNDHECMDLPALVAGAGVPTNTHHQLPEQTPMANLLLTGLNHLGVADARFGDSTGTVDAVVRPS